MFTNINNMEILEVTQGSGTATKDTRVFKRLSYECSDAKHLSTINSAVVTGKWRIEISIPFTVVSYRMEFITRTSHKPLSEFAQQYHSHQNSFAFSYI